MERATFDTKVNGLPYRVVAMKFEDGRQIVTVHVERKGKWAMLNEHDHRRAYADAKANVANQINEFYTAH